MNCCPFSTNSAIAMVNIMGQPLSGIIMEMIILRVQRRNHTYVASANIVEKLATHYFIGRD